MDESNTILCELNYSKTWQKISENCADKHLNVEQHAISQKYSYSEFVRVLENSSEFINVIPDLPFLYD